MVFSIATATYIEIIPYALHSKFQEIVQFRTLEGSLKTNKKQKRKSVKKNMEATKKTLKNHIFHNILVCIIKIDIPCHLNNGEHMAKNMHT